MSRDACWSPFKIPIPPTVGNLTKRWYVEVTARMAFKVGRPMIALYDEGQSTTTNSTDWMCWQGCVPSSTGKFSTPSEWILSPVKPYNADFIGSNFAPTRSILLSVERKRMSAELPLSIKILYTFRLAILKATTIASLWGCHKPLASSSVKMIGSLERRGALFLCSARLIWWGNGSDLAWWA